MPDREKVIETLEACVLKDPDDSRDCRHCPRCNYGAFITTSCINGVMADALALLKAQEPKPPIIKKNTYGWKFYYCPSCGKEFYQNNKFNFCEKCGQAVKWE